MQKLLVGTLPIVKPDANIKFKVFKSTNEFVTDLYTNDFTKYVIEQTGINFEWEQPLASDAEARLNLLFSTNDYPEIVIGNINRDMINSWALQKMIIPLDELIEKYAPNTVKFLADQPMRKYTLLAGEGQIYAMPIANECLHCYTDGGIIYYYVPFQTALNLSVPKTLDEFTDNLKAIRDRDPNGNGKQDEIPLILKQDQRFNLINVFALSFYPMCVTEQYGLTLINNEPVLQMLEPKAKEAFKYMKMLVDEGLINKDFLSLTDADPIVEGETDIAGWVLGGHTNNIFKKGAGTGRWPMVRAVPAFKGPEGIGYSSYKGTYGSSSPGVAITDKCKYPDVAVRMIDWMYELEVMVNGYIGPKGEAWEWPDPGAVGLNGKPALYKLLVNFGLQRENCGWDQGNPALRTADFRLGEQATEVERIHAFMKNPNATLEEAKQIMELASFNEVNNYEAANLRLTTALPDEYNVPPRAFTLEESQRIAEIRAVADPYYEQAVGEFIIGIRNIESDWDTFISEMKRMGTDDYVKIYKEALKRMYPDRFK